VYNISKHSTFQDWGLAEFLQHFEFTQSFSHWGDRSTYGNVNEATKVVLISYSHQNSTRCMQKNMNTGKSHHDLAWPCHQSEIAAHFEKCPIKLLTTFTIGKKTQRKKCQTSCYRVLILLFLKQGMNIHIFFTKYSKEDKMGLHKM